VLSIFRRLTGSPNPLIPVRVLHNASYWVTSHGRKTSSSASPRPHRWLSCASTVNPRRSRSYYGFSLHVFSKHPPAHEFKRNFTLPKQLSFNFWRKKQRLQYSVSKHRNYLFNIPDPVPNIFKRFFIGDVID